MGEPIHFGCLTIVNGPIRGCRSQFAMIFGVMQKEAENRKRELARLVVAALKLADSLQLSSIGIRLDHARAELCGEIPPTNSFTDAQAYISSISDFFFDPSGDADGLGS